MSYAFFWALFCGAIGLAVASFAPPAGAQAPPASSQPGLSLAAAVSQAESLNPDLKRLAAVAERLSWAKPEALSAYLPRLSLEYDHFFSSAYLREDIVFGGAVVSFPAAFPQDNFTLDASIALFDGFEGWHKYKAAALSAEAARLDASRAKFEVDEKARTAFYGALAAQKLREVAQENVKTLEEHLERAKLTERTGFGTRFDVLRIDATLEEARAELEQSEGHFQNSRDALNEAMGLEQEDNRALLGELPVLSAADVPRDLALSSADRDDLSAQNKREQASRELASAARGSWYPSLQLFAEDQYYMFGSFDPAVQASSSPQNASSIGLRLKWNLFDGGASYAREKQADQAILEAASQTHKALARLPREFAAWKRNYFESISLYRARTRALAQYEESVRLAAVGLKAGTRTHTEALDAELDLFRARAGVVRAQASALEALGQLELAVGHKIWLGGGSDVAL
jgi:outer membrane protein TolC